MKRILYICTLLTGLVLWSCENNFGESIDNNGPKGIIDVSLCADGTFDISTDAAEGTKAPGEVTMTSLPKPEDFDISISRLDKQKNIYTGKYSAMDHPIKADVGRYSFTASFGEENTWGFVDENCSNTHFLYTEEFDLGAQEEKKVQAQAQMTKVLMHVYFDAESMASLTSYEAIISALDNSNPTTFSKDETRDACYPPGEYQLVFSATKDGVTKTYKADRTINQPEGKSYVKINIAMERVDDAEFSATITYKDDVETVALEEFVLPWYLGPTDAPTITQSGVTGYSAVVRSTPSLSGLTTTLKADGRIGNCVLTFTSEYLKSQLGGVSSIDLATESQATIDKLATLGIKVSPQTPLKALTSATIDFSGLAANCADGKATNNEYKDELTLTLTDMKEKKATTVASYSFDVALVNATLDANDYNAFAKSIRGISASVTDGDISKYKLQYKSASASTWTDITSANASGKISVDKISGLSPTTGYNIRLIHTHGSTITELATKSLTTEEAAGIPNGDFESWTTNTRSHKYTEWFSSKTWNRNWYQPNNGWAVNSMKSMRNTESNLTNFPVVQKIINDKANGSAAAQLIIFVYSNGTTNAALPITALSDNQFYTGELFLGTVDGSGNTTSEGISFASRPQYVKFNYNYTAENNNNFYVLCQVLASDNSVIAEYLNTNGPTSSGWAELSIPLTYSDITKKAAKIKLHFKAEANKTKYTNDDVKKRDIEDNGSTVSIFTGCILKVDNIRTEYD